MAAVAAVVPNRYIVELSTEPVATHVSGGRGALHAAEAQTHRERIHVEQAAVGARIETVEGGTVLGGVDTLVNALFVRIPDAKASRLENIPGVLRVHKVYRMEHLLDRAAVIHKLPEAWSQVGIDRAGLGIKIGIIDSGIDIGHPGFQDPTLPMPAGFPLVNADSDIQFTNNKVIVARAYPDLLDSPDPDPSARDHDGHGTAVAMCAAGVQTAGPLATISGFAPKAYLGSYKVEGSPGANSNPSSDATLKAFEDATNDGMDIISLSSGVPLPLSFDANPTIAAVEHAASLGVIVIVSAGNQGPGIASISSPASAPAAIAAGASRNDRTFVSQAVVNGVGSFTAYPGDKYGSSAVTAPLADVAALDGNGQACMAFPANSLTGKIALILRGPCTFEDKLNNVAAAGAVGGLIYTTPDRDAGRIGEGSATLPAQMVSNADGLTIKSQLASQPALIATLNFGSFPQSVDPNRISSFSSRGPNVDFAIKPDLVAVGQDVYTAAQKFDPAGDVYDPAGFALIDGTSFSAPITAGAAAVIKGFRPGLTSAQYRSLLIDNAGPIALSDGTPARVQQAGGGRLDVSAALNANATAVPPTLSFSAGTGTLSTVQTLTISNIGTTADTFRLSAVSRDGGIAPRLSASSLPLQPGASANVAVTFTGSLLQAGQYEGAIHIQSANAPSVDTHVPYWYGVGGPASQIVDFTVLDETTGRAGARVRQAFLFRVVDESGIPLLNPDVQVGAGAGGGSFVKLDHLSEIPGLLAITIQLGLTPGTNIFHVQVGDLNRDFAILGR
ncbi:MAG: S8 family serine peptidase [Acidobacteriota bacterium]|nr:S8 family serine peptidase [Acidobacteriota bacterium]